MVVHLNYVCKNTNGAFVDIIYRELLNVNFPINIHTSKVFALLSLRYVNIELMQTLRVSAMYDAISALKVTRHIERTVIQAMCYLKSDNYTCI